MTLVEYIGADTVCDHITKLKEMKAELRDDLIKRHVCRGDKS